MPPILLGALIGLALCQVALFLTTVFLHRTLSHKAMTLSPPLRMAFRFATWILTGIRPRQWVAVHRKHHAYTDVPGDPHSPVIEGFWAVQLGNVALYRKAARDQSIVNKYAKDLPEDAWDRIIFNRSLVGLAIGVAVLYFIFGAEVAIVAAVVHTVSYLLLNAAVNAVGHVFGSRDYENTATNNQWLAWLTAGEGLHNNHHAAPTAARLAFSQGQIDPGWWVISLFAKMGLAQVRHSTVRFKGTPTKVA